MPTGRPRKKADYSQLGPPILDAWEGTKNFSLHHKRVLYLENNLPPRCDQHPVAWHKPLTWRSGLMQDKPILLLAANPIVERFLSKIKISRTRFYNGTPCWEWQAKKNRTGYGQFHVRLDRYKYRNVFAHRYALDVIAGVSLGSLFALHHCDNPPCCNPAHLYAGTVLDNARDMVERNRASQGDRHYARMHPELLARGETHFSRTRPELIVRGEKQGLSKLTDGKVKLIRAMYDLPGKPFGHRKLSAIFGVSRGNISFIVSGKTWKHLLASSEPEMARQGDDAEYFQMQEFHAETTLQSALSRAQTFLEQW